MDSLRQTNSIVIILSYVTTFLKADSVASEGRFML
jgi:hypothetical protein